MHESLFLFILATVITSTIAYLYNYGDIKKLVPFKYPFMFLIIPLSLNYLSNFTQNGRYQIIPLGKESGRTNTYSGQSYTRDDTWVILDTRTGKIKR